MAPFGALSAANWLAMPAQRYMHDHGLTRQQLGWIVALAVWIVGIDNDGEIGASQRGKIGDLGHIPARGPQNDRIFIVAGCKNLCPPRRVDIASHR